MKGVKECPSLILSDWRNKSDWSKTFWNVRLCQFWLAWVRTKNDKTEWLRRTKHLQLIMAQNRSYNRDGKIIKKHFDGRNRPMVRFYYFRTNCAIACGTLISGTTRTTKRLSNLKAKCNVSSKHTGGFVPIDFYLLNTRSLSKKAVWALRTMPLTVILISVLAYDWDKMITAQLWRYDQLSPVC